LQVEADELSCRQFVELVTDYLEAALPPEVRARCDEHGAACGPCATYLEQVRQTVLALGRFVDESLDPVTREALLHRFRAWQGSS
jgi:hypothetical protein